MDMNVSIGSISENDAESDVNITHSSDNEEDDAIQQTRTASDSRNDSKIVSESDNEFDEDNGEMDPLARLLSTPTHEAESSDILPKMEVGESDRSASEIIMPKKMNLSSEHEKEMERRAEARNKREAEEEEREKMQVLVSNFTEEQLDRYEMYRRSAFPKAAIKRVYIDILIL